MQIVNSKFNIWEGIYKSFNDVSQKGLVFESSRWLDSSVEKLTSQLACLTSNRSLREISVSKDYALPVIVSLLLSNKESLSVVDWGGGFAQTYLACKYSSSSAHKLIYYVIDKQSVIEKAGEILSKDYPDLYFSSEIPESVKKTDIVHIGSALQYIEDWELLLSKLLSLKPSYFVLSDLMAGDIPTYVSTQNYYGTRVPVWFWNLNEFINRISDFGYESIYASPYSAKILGVQKELPMDNFPDSHRLVYSCNLIFKNSR